MPVSHDDILSSVDLLGTELKHGDTVAILVTPYYESCTFGIITEGWNAGNLRDYWNNEHKAFSTKELIEQGYQSCNSIKWTKAFNEDFDDTVWRGICIEGYDNVTKKWKSADVDKKVSMPKRAFGNQVTKVHDNGIGILRGVIYRMRQVKKDEVNLLQLKIEGTDDFMWIDTLNECVIKDNGELSDKELIAKFKSIWK